MTTKAEATQLPIHAAIVKIMQELGAIGKDRKNQSQGYQFRGIDDVYNAVNPLFGKFGVFSVPEVLETHREEKATKSGGSMTATHLRIRYTFYAGDGTFVQATVEGEGMDSGDKSTNKAMAVAHKYAILQLLAIPTEDPKDPENDDPQPIAKPKAQSQMAEPKLTSQPRGPINADGEMIWTIGKKKGNPIKDVDRETLISGVKWMKNKDATGFANLIGAAERYLSVTAPSIPLAPDGSDFGSKPTAALMELVNKATEKARLDTAQSRANKHRDEAEITEEQHRLITNAIAQSREILG